MGPALQKVLEELLVAYGKLDTDGILFYSRDKQRDFANQAEKLAEWRRRIAAADLEDQVDRINPPRP